MKTTIKRGFQALSFVFAMSVAVLPALAITHPSTTASPSFNNYTDSGHFYTPDEHYFSTVSKGDFTLRGDNLTIDTVSPQYLTFFTYLNNSGTTNATGVKVKVNGFYLNGSGKYVSQPFNTSLTLTHTITAANTSPLSVTDTATVTSQNGNYLRLRFSPSASAMWVRPISIGGYNYVAQIDQTALFDTGVSVGSRDVPLTGTFVPGDDQRGDDQRTELQYYMLLEKAYADLAITKTADKTLVGVGDTVTYTLNYTNSVAGSIEAKNVVIIDDYNETLLAVNAASLPAACADDGTKITCNFDELRYILDNGSITYTATTIATGYATNTASISSLMGDANMANNTASKAISVSAGAVFNPGDVVINELAWAGSSLDTADEWIELRNMTASAIDLSGFQITAKSGASDVLMLEIPVGSVIPANGYFLIANFADNSASSLLNVAPDVVNTAVSLPNTALQIKLYAGDTTATLLDTAGNGVGAPLAGSTVGYASMARKWKPGNGTLATNWFTSQLSQGFDNTTAAGSPGNSAATNNVAFPETVYSDGANVADWVIYDNNPAGASVSSILDSGRTVINFLGSNMYNAAKVLQDNASWTNGAQKIIQFDMKTSNGYILIVTAMTNKGMRYYYYDQNPTDKLKSLTDPSYVHHGLGSFTVDGRWRTFTRNLTRDAQDADGADTVIQEIISFSVRSQNIKVDNIKLLTEMPISVYEDAEDGLITRWYSEADTSVNGVVTSLSVTNIAEAGNKFIRLEGVYTPNDPLDPPRNPSALAKFTLHSGIGDWQNWWKNHFQTNITWQWRWRGNAADLLHNDFRFTVAFNAKKADGTIVPRYLVYMPRTAAAPYIQKNQYCYINIGARDTWDTVNFATITRNLETDLNSCEALGNATFGTSLTIDEIIRFVVNGVGDIDNVKLY